MQDESESGQKPLKSRAVTTRLTPFSHHCVSLLARANGQTISESIESCIHSKMHGHVIPTQEPTKGEDLAWLARETWSVNRVERVIKLGILAPELLEYEEANIWRVLDGTPELWREDSVRFARKLEDIEWAKIENRLNSLDLFACENADKYPVEGLSEGHIRELGWDLSPNRYVAKKGQSDADI